jgi:uncharacterized protein (DUF2062 family)
VAAVSTLVSNPLTYAPIFLLAYQTGAAVLGVEVQEAKAEALVTAVQQPEEDERGWVKRAKAIGKPLFLGLAIFAAVGGMLAWALVHVLWTVGVWLKRRRRRRREVRPA